MKKLSSYCRLIPMILVAVFLLSGCVSLDTLKDRQAVWADASQKSIIWRDRKYVYLTDTYETYFAPLLNEEDYINLTESDVPVLLSEYVGDYLEVSLDENFLIYYEDVYCIEDKYEEMKEYLQGDIRMESYAYSYCEEYEEYVERMEFFTEKEMNLLAKIDQSQFVEKEYSEDEYYEWLADIYLCSEDMMFRKYCDVSLCIGENGEYIWEEYQDDMYSTYIIPQEYNAIIEEVFEDAIEAYYEFYGEYEEY